MALPQLGAVANMLILRNFFHRLRSDNRGSIIVEFAFVMPIFMILSIGGVELANYAVTRMRVDQIALNTADSASRIGEGSLLNALRIFEHNINDVFAGADAQSSNLKIFGTYIEKIGGVSTVKGKGRIIISSLEPMANPNTTNRYKIGWQRCKGQLTSYTPQYGTHGQPSGTNMVAMGPSGQQVIVPNGMAMIFVEVRYRYEPLFPINLQNQFGLFDNNLSYRDINAVKAMIVRDDRDMSQIYPSAGVTASTC
jgi:TadE-like protein